MAKRTKKSSRKSKKRSSTKLINKSKAIHYVSGRLGVDQGFYQEGQNTISEYNSGEGSNTYYIDLTYPLSKQLGKQLDAMNTFRIKQITIGLRNEDDANNAEYALAAAGTLGWYQPTKMRVDALQYARKYKRMIAPTISINNSGDPYSMWVADKRYKGMRFNWNGPNQIETGQIIDSTTIMSGSYFNMKDVFERYAHVKGGFPAEEGRPTSATGMALWNSRTGYDDPSEIHWSADIVNKIFDDGATNRLLFNPRHTDFSLSLTDNHISALCGMLRLEVNHTNTDNPAFADGVAGDDYQLWCTIGIEGWDAF